jgi:hypothetical protein
LSKYEDLFLEGLAHSENRIKELIFQEVYYIIDLKNQFNDLMLSIFLLIKLQLAADDEQACEQLSTKMELLQSCLQAVGSDDSSIAGKASKVFMSLARQRSAASVLVSPPIVEEMRIVSRCCSLQNLRYPHHLLLRIPRKHDILRRERANQFPSVRSINWRHSCPAKRIGTYNDFIVLPTWSGLSRATRNHSETRR